MAVVFSESTRAEPGQLLTWRMALRRLGSPSLPRRAGITAGPPGPCAQWTSGWTGLVFNDKVRVNQGSWKNEIKTRRKPGLVNGKGGFGHRVGAAALPFPTLLSQRGGPHGHEQFFGGPCSFQNRRIYSSTSPTQHVGEPAGCCSAQRRPGANATPASCWLLTAGLGLGSHSPPPTRASLLRLGRARGRSCWAPRAGVVPARGSFRCGQDGQRLGRQPASLLIRGRPSPRTVSRVPQTVRCRRSSAGPRDAPGEPGDVAAVHVRGQASGNLPPHRLFPQHERWETNLRCGRAWGTPQVTGNGLRVASAQPSGGAPTWEDISTLPLAPSAFRIGISVPLVWPDPPGVDR